MTTQERGRDVLPIPDRAYTGLIKYDAKDPEAVFPKMKLLRPPESAPQRSGRITGHRYGCRHPGHR
jgi:hypothetical protein